MPSTLFRISGPDGSYVPQLTADAADRLRAAQTANSKLAASSSEPTSTAPTAKRAKKDTVDTHDTHTEAHAATGEGGKSKRNLVRADGRAPTTARPIYVRRSFNTAADGSAYLESGNTKVLVSVFGPRQATATAAIAAASTSAAVNDASSGRAIGADSGVDAAHNVASQTLSGSLSCDFKFAPFAKSNVSHLGYLRDSTEHELSLQVRSALQPAVMTHTFPKAVVDIFVLVIESDGDNATLANAITASSLALADAGIEMYDMVTAAPVAVADTIPFVDLTTAEENHLMQNRLLDVLSGKYDDKKEKKQTTHNTVGNIVLSYMPSLKQVSNVMQSGELDTDSLESLITLAVEYCVDAHILIRKTILEPPIEKDISGSKRK